MTTLNKNLREQVSAQFSLSKNKTDKIVCFAFGTKTLPFGGKQVPTLSHAKFSEVICCAQKRKIRKSTPAYLRPTLFFNVQVVMTAPVCLPPHHSIFASHIIRL